MPSQVEAPRAGRAGREGGHVIEMQRRRLLLAFTEVLAEGGLQTAGIGRICTRAGVSRRTFYDLFEDREACFIAALDLSIEQIAHTVVPAYQGAERWRERIRRALTELLECFDRDPGLARLCVVETLKGDPRVLERRRRMIDVLAGAIDEGGGEAKPAIAPSPLTAESAVGGVLSVIHARLLDPQHPSLLELVGPLTSMIVQPYLGAAAARRELHRPTPSKSAVANNGAARSVGDQPLTDPFRDLPIRFTYRTARVIAVIAAQPGASNREIGQAAGATDQGQISKLLRRLEQHDLIANRGNGQPHGEPNAWTLTPRGQAIHAALGPQVAG